MPVPFHGDQCNGFSPIGRFALRNLFTAWLLLVNLVHLLAYIVVGDLPGTEIQAAEWWALYVATFLWTMLASLAMTVWPVHVIMVRHRSNVLKATADKMTVVLAESDRVSGPPDTTTVVRLLGLELKYQIVRREFKGWPFSFWSER